jgi:hypothetical protein
VDNSAQAEKWEALDAELREASPFEIVQMALKMVGNDVAIAFRLDSSIPF